MLSNINLTTLLYLVTILELSFAIVIIPKLIKSRSKGSIYIILSYVFVITGMLAISHSQFFNSSLMRIVGCNIRMLGDLFFGFGVLTLINKKNNKLLFLGLMAIYIIGSISFITNPFLREELLSLINIIVCYLIVANFMKSQKEEYSLNLIVRIFLGYGIVGFLRYSTLVIYSMFSTIIIPNLMGVVFILHIIMVIFKNIGTLMLALELSNLRLYEMSQNDFLTKLHNKEYILEKMRNHLLGYYGKEMKFTIAMVDLDCFKSFNNKYGHEFGDDYLKEFSRIANKTLGNHEIIRRCGGEEFLIILRGICAEKSMVQMEHFRRTFESFGINGETTTFSAGLCEVCAQNDHIDEREILNKVDMALYFAKANGKNLIFNYSDIELKDERRLSFEEMSHLRRMESFNLHYNLFLQIVIQMDQDLKIVFANDFAIEKSKVSSFEEMEGTFCYQAMFGNDEPCNGCPLVDTLKDGIARETDLTVTFNSQQTKIRTRSNPIFGKNDEIVGIFEVSTIVE